MTTRRRSVVSRQFSARHPAWTVLLALLAIGFVITYWYVVTIAFAAFLAVKWWQHRQGQVQHRSEVAAQVAARADYEHQLLLRGDPRGVFGQYPPAA